MNETQTFGRYELRRKLATGGMAEIYLARQWGEGGFYRDVVVKKLFRHLAENDKALQMFQYEARLLAELTHPNIPQVYDLGHAEGHWYIALEHVDGFNLRELVEAGAKLSIGLPLPVSVGIAMQVCEALHHAHERTDRGGKPLRIVHRDVTPQNIMITRDGIVKLLDFGVAQTAARKESEPGVPRGTFSYMAPEQVRGRALDKRADVFALGVILYELTTGIRVFDGTDIQVMTSIVEQDVVPPSHHYPDYPRALEEVLLAALVRDRSKRMPSAAHFGYRLEEFALRYQLVTGPRALSRFIAQVAPHREHDIDVALVKEKPRLELVSESEAMAAMARDSSVPPPSVSPPPTVPPVDDLHVVKTPVLPQPYQLAEDAAFDEPTLPPELRADGFDERNIDSSDLTPAEDIDTARFSVPTGALEKNTIRREITADELEVLKQGTEERK